MALASFWCTSTWLCIYTYGNGSHCALMIKFHMFNMLMLSMKKVKWETEDRDGEREEKTSKRILTVIRFCFYISPKAPKFIAHRAIKIYISPKEWKNGKKPYEELHTNWFFCYSAILCVVHACSLQCFSVRFDV